MALKDKILVIEDEESVSRFISTVLNANGYESLSAVNAAQGISMFKSHCPEVVILDLGLPDDDGINVIKRIREFSRTPIIVVSARITEADKVEALDFGADDYITKPFGTSELLARIRTAIRHTRFDSLSDNVAISGVFRTGELVVDYDKHRVFLKGNDVKLTLNEFKIVALLAKYSGKVVTYDFLIKEIWGPNAAGDNRILRVNMANIRRKLEANPAVPEYIYTEVGVGYRMTDERII